MVEFYDFEGCGVSRGEKYMAIGTSNVIVFALVMFSAYDIYFCFASLQWNQFD